jgi:hypothetical protein
MVEPCRVVAVDPGGEIVIRGAVHSSHDGTVLDAMTSRPGAVGAGNEGDPVLGGLYDLEAGGWRLVSRDPNAHTYRLAATGTPGTACTASNVASPCLPLRLLPLAQTRLLAASDFARTLSGEVTLEILNPDSTPVALPPFAQRYGSWLLGGGACALLLALGIRQQRLREATPLARLQRKANAVRQRLVGADAVYRELVPALDTLIRHAEELFALRARLHERIERADPTNLRRRLHDLEQNESTSATTRSLLQEQIDRVTRWQHESARATSRITEVEEYLNVLSQRLDENLNTVSSDREASTREALAALELEVQSAIEGAREADALLS